MIGKTDCLNDLYMLAHLDESLFDISTNTMSSTISCNVHVDNWHFRLGHLSHKGLTLGLYMVWVRL